MDFKQIIENNFNSFSGHAKSWCKFAFHFTDISNAVEILASHTLYSRDKAISSNLMHNDNASKQVIDLTSSAVTKNVRFYFRPMTPTQFHNEGFKHEAIRFNGENSANVPVPIFFVFDLEKLLNQNGCQFSEMSQAGVGCNICTTVDEFQNFAFDKIYSEGHSNKFENEKKYRHAEILFPESYNIDQSLLYVFCRNEVERQTLLKLLLDKSLTAYPRYKQRIYVSSKRNIFFYNGLYIDNCYYCNGAINIIFSDSYQRLQYAKRHRVDLDDIELKVSIIVKWIANGNVYRQAERDLKINYLQCDDIQVKTDIEDKTERLEVVIYFEQSLMCDIFLPVNQSNVM